MQIGVTFPRDGLGNDPAACRDFAQAAEALGYTHLHAGDHVVGRADLQDSARPIIDPFVLFPALAIITSRISFLLGVLVLPQRQTVLVAKQAAGLDVLSGGRLQCVFAVGWNEVEYQALNEDFHTRGRRLDEQIAVLRALWTEPNVRFSGRWHQLDGVGINPLPAQRPIPLWLAGYDERALRRTARLADGWFPQSPPGFPPGSGPAVVGETVERLRGYLREEGRDPATFRLNGTLRTDGRTPDQWRATLAGWRGLGATHVTLNTSMAGPTLDRHLDVLRRFQAEVVATA